MSYKKIILCLSAVFISILVFLTISHVLPFNSETHYSAESDPEEYAKLSSICNEMTKYILSADGISCNFNIKNPEVYLGNSRPDSLGTFDTYEFTKDNTFLENTLSKLSAIKKNKLSDKDTLTYNALYKSLSLSLELGKHPLYTEPLSPISGIHTQLPILLGEYHFYDESYVETYFNLLHSVPTYFSQIIEFEKNKAENNMFMSTTLANKVISQCRDFIAKPIHNHLITAFDEKAKDFSQYNSYSITHKNIILNEIIPAYESLICAIESLKPHCTPARGLCKQYTSKNTSDNSGKMYYSHLFCQQTGSSLSPDEAYKLLNKTLKSCLNNIAQTDIQTESATDSVNNSQPTPSSNCQTAYNMVATLKQTMLSSYPALSLNSHLEIKPVPTSLENSLSPAMYLTPPIDDFKNDCIYINNASCDTENLYTTLAHESFPGHMYQIRYFHSLNPEPVRLLLNMPGYSEGWATYAELNTIDSMGYDTQTSTLLKNNKLAILCIYSIIDIGIHYYGWELFDCVEFLTENGFNDINIAKEIYEDIAYEPVIYPKYTIGCIEFMNMKNYAMKKKSKTFSPIDFHKLILETGPIWFEDLWRIIKENY